MATTPTPTPTVNAVGLAQLKADFKAWATTLVNELATKVEGGVPLAQAHLDEIIDKL